VPETTGVVTFDGVAAEVPLTATPTVTQTCEPAFVHANSAVPSAAPARVSPYAVATIASVELSAAWLNRFVCEPVLAGPVVCVETAPTARSFDPPGVATSTAGAADVPAFVATVPNGVV
jgi:hypothetical protein